MKITTHGMAELNECIALQQRARELHLPVFPVVSWEGTLFDCDGNIKEIIKSKSNSYVRNALNIMAIYGGYAYMTGDNTYANGSFATKNLSGTVRNAYIDVRTYAHNYSAGETGFYVDAGYGDSAESIDDYKLANAFGSGSSENQLTKGTSSRATTYTTSPYQVTTTFKRLFINDYGSSQTVKEIGLCSSMIYADSSSELQLVVRDVLASSISLGSGEAIEFVYRFETLFG